MFVRNNDGKMVPLGTLVMITPMVGPSLISLFNLYPTATIIGLPAQGVSSGQALTLITARDAQCFKQLRNLLTDCQSQFGRRHSYDVPGLVVVQGSNA
jgi:multidrug efflux pump subunit AcrB